MSERPHIDTWFSAEEEDCLSHKEMQGYARGQLDETGKHRVERHLLNCDLCALAYEGIAEAPAEEVEAAVAHITQKSWGRVHRSQAKVQRSAYVWLSSAAAILLLIVVGFFVVDRQNKHHLKQVAESMLRTPETEMAPEPEPLEERNRSESTHREDNLYAEGRATELAKNEQESDPGLAPAPKRDAPPPPPLLEEIVEDEELSMDAPTEDMLTDVDAEDPPNTLSLDVTSTGNGLANRSQYPQTETGNTYRDQYKPMESADKADDLTLGAGFDAAADETPVITHFNGAVADSISPQDGFEFAYSDEDADDMAFGDDGFGLAEEEVAEFKVGQAPKEISETKDPGGYLAGNALPEREEESTAILQDVVVASDLRKSAKRSRSVPMAEKSKQEKPEETAPLSLYEQGMAAYKKGAYQEGAQLLRQASVQTPSNLYAHFYAAICYLEMEQPGAALFHLNRVLESPQSSLQEDAQWYKSIALLQEGKKREAKEVLENLEQSGKTRSRDARKALDQLEQP